MVTGPFIGAHLNGAEWDHLFLLLQTRSGNRCEAQAPVCAAGPRGDLSRLTRNEVAIQHRQPRGMGGTSRADAHTLAVLMLVCRACHIYMETAERGYAQRQGWFVPAPVPGKPTAATDPAQVVLILPGGRRVRLDPTNPEYLGPPDGILYAAA